MKIADYFAEFSLKIDKPSIATFDKTLDSINSKIRKLGVNAEKGINLKLSAFDVNQTKLNVVVGNALDIASARNVLDISRFNIDQSHLNSALVTAMREASLVASRASTLRPDVRVSGANEGGIRPRHAAVAGGIAGGLSRVYGPALALGLGGYGLSQLNQRNQQVVSAQLQSSAVVQQAGGTAEQGADSFQYLRKEANRIGFSYLESSGDYNKLISGLTGAGFGVKDSQKVFSGFAELARVNKLDKTTQNRLFRALSQVAGKDQLMAEELTGQIAEALPGGVALFAKAYKRQTGQDLGLGDVSANSSEDIKRLLAATKDRKIRGEILIAAGQIASEQANKGGAFDRAKTASQAEQARYQNSVDDLAVVASNAGVEEGFARIFRTLNAGLSESNGLVETLAGGFNDATKFADDILLFPQSFIRALEGKDSLVADFLGVDKTQGLIKDWNQIKTIWGQLTDGPTPTWLPTLEATSKELAAILKTGAEFAQYLKNLHDAPKNGAPEASFATQPITATYQGLGRFFGGVGSSIDAAKTRGRAVYEDESSPYYGKPELYDADMAAGINKNENLSKLQFDGLDSEIQLKKDFENERFRENLPRVVNSPSLDVGAILTQNPIESSLGLYQNNGQTPADIASQNRDAAMTQAAQTVTNNSVTNQFDISINVDATLAGIEIEAQAQAAAQAFSTALTGAFEQVQVNYPTK